VAACLLDIVVFVAAWVDAIYFGVNSIAVMVWSISLRLLPVWHCYRHLRCGMSSNSLRLCKYTCKYTVNIHSV
jgi:hypothetical protein